MTLPQWMMKMTRSAVPVTERGRRGTATARRVFSFYEIAAREVVAGESASRDGFLQRLEPRSKVISALLLIVATTIATRLSISAAAFVAAIAIAAASRVDIRAMFRFIAPAAIVAVVVILPSILNVITPGKTIVHLADLGRSRTFFGMSVPSDLTITAEGMVVATRFVLRSLACVTWALTLLLTTRGTVLLQALRSMGLPRMVALTLLMMYRYLFVLLRNAEETRVARDSRTISPESMIEADKRGATDIARWFQTARRMAEDIHLSMAARGFSSMSQGFDHFGRRSPYWPAIVVATAASAAIVYADRILS